MTAPHPDAIERYHRRPADDKTLDPKPRRCTAPLCRSGWEALLGSPYCLPCHQRIRDRGDELQAKVSA